MTAKKRADERHDDIQTALKDSDARAQKEWSGGARVWTRVNDALNSEGKTCDARGRHGRWRYAWVWASASAVSIFLALMLTLRWDAGPAIPATDIESVVWSEIFENGDETTGELKDELGYALDFYVNILQGGNI